MIGDQERTTIADSPVGIRQLHILVALTAPAVRTLGGKDEERKREVPILVKEPAFKHRLAGIPNACPVSDFRDAGVWSQGGERLTPELQSGPLLRAQSIKPSLLTTSIALRVVMPSDFRMAAVTPYGSRSDSKLEINRLSEFSGLDSKDIRRHQTMDKSMKLGVFRRKHPADQRGPSSEVATQAIRTRGFGHI